jgi:hypothetical protein
MQQAGYGYPDHIPYPAPNDEENLIMRRFWFTVAVIALLAIAAMPGIGYAQGSQARVRVMHASPDAPAVDIYAGGQRVLSDVPFFAVSGYLTVPAGDLQLQVVPAGGALDDAVIDATATFEGGKDYTVAAVGTVANIAAVAYEDDNSAPPAGQARVRVIHASPDAPAVDVKVAGTDSAAVEGLEFPDGAYVTVPAGGYAFDITPAGSSQVVFTTPELRFESGWVYTLVATGEIGKGGFWVQSRVDRVAP